MQIKYIHLDIIHLLNRLGVKNTKHDNKNIQGRKISILKK